MDQPARDDVLQKLADLVRRVAEASGRPWVYGTVVIHVGDDLPAIRPVVVVPECNVLRRTPGARGRRSSG